MSMPIWVCLTRRRTSDILELTIKKTLLHRAAFFFRKLRMGCADWAPNQRQIIIVHSHSQTHLSAACRQEAIRRCRARQGKVTAQPLCGAGEERNRQWPFRQRAMRRAEERNAPNSSPFSCFRLPPATNKKDRHSAVLLRGAGGSRTLVQTSDRCAFYMLILWLIVGPALDTGTQGRP